MSKDNAPVPTVEESLAKIAKCLDYVCTQMLEVSTSLDLIRESQQAMADTLEKIYSCMP